MRKIYGIGETVFDIIFKNGQPQAAKPGGAMLNSAVSLGRIGLPVSFISEYANDDVGKLIDTFLSDNGVGTGFVDHFINGKTKLALAFLNEKNDASYTFYQNYPENRLEINFPGIQKDDIILCGSIYAITEEIRTKFRDFAAGAKEKEALIIYDPNFRPSHSSELEKLIPMIVENMQTASLIRGSDEDFKNIFGAATPDEAWGVISRYCKCMVYTANAEGVHVRTTGFSGKFQVKQIKPVSTIGAGDNFNAGMMAALYKNQITGNQLDKMGGEMWSRIVSMGIDFATNVCLSYENYISSEFASRYFSASRFQM
ncbi:MAG TPA: PfkB family carbohydrate kinase [Bacteroidales bacterium]|nr:PfkB family carbohydrate kinase [Bacteroidales bacterium]